MMSRSVSLDNHVNQGVILLGPLRKQWLRAYLSSWLFALVGGVSIAGTWAMAKNEPIVAWCVTGTVVLCMFLMMRRSTKKGETLARSFNKWRAEAVTQIHADAALDTNSYIDQSSFDASLLYRSVYNRYSGWNFIQLGNMKCSSLSVKHEYQETYYETETYTDSNGTSQTRQVQKTRTVVRPVFDGTMIEIPAPAPYPVTAILQHPSHGLVKDLQKLRPESTFLLKNYAISVSDQFAGHRMLTPSMQVDIEEFSRMFKYLPGYSYRGNRVYVCLPSFYLSYGDRPGKWRAITTAKLIKVIENCQKSIEFLESITPRLIPDTDTHTLQAV
jgi:hypothetical protein